MTRARARVFGSEQGAVFVQVGISLFVLMAFNVFVLDYGMMWIGRSQAQNAADAGALAGAIAMGYDDFDDPPASDGVAAQSALNVASANLIWQESGTPSVLFSCPSGVAGRCVRVDVYRNGENGSTPMPTLFGPILGVTNQGVRATATGIVGAGNATDCLRPIAFADDWLEQRAPSTEFNSYDETTGAPLGVPRPLHARPAHPKRVAPRSPVDLGERIIWQLGANPLTSPITRTSASNLTSNSTLQTLVLALTLPLSTPLEFQQNVDTCSGQMVELGDTLQVSLTPPPSTTFDTLLSQDTRRGVERGRQPHRQQLCAGMRADQPAPDTSRALRS